MTDLWHCQSCDDDGREPVVSLNRWMRCEVCGSNAVVSVEKLLAAQRAMQEKRITVMHPKKRKVLGGGR